MGTKYSSNCLQSSCPADHVHCKTEVAQAGGHTLLPPAVLYSTDVSEVFIDTDPHSTLIAIG